MGEPVTRWCDGPCGRELPEDDVHFPRTGERRYLARVCRQCRVARTRARRRMPCVNRRYLARHRARYREDIERRKAYRREWGLRRKQAA